MNFERTNELNYMIPQSGNSTLSLLYYIYYYSFCIVHRAKEWKRRHIRLDNSEIFNSLLTSLSPKSTIEFN